MVTAISENNVSVALACRKPGKMSHARWLTTANRILRLYVSQVIPDRKRRIIAEFVMKVYAPVWFEIKTKPNCKYGAVHIFSMIKRTTIIYPVIQRNGYFAHPENLILAMLADNRVNVRKLALRRVLNCKPAVVTGEIRNFSIPKLNFNADDYIDLDRYKTNFSAPT